MVKLARFLHLKVCPDAGGIDGGHVGSATRGTALAQGGRRPLTTRLAAPWTRHRLPHNKLRPRLL